MDNTVDICSVEADGFFQQKWKNLRCNFRKFTSRSTYSVHLNDLKRYPTIGADDSGYYFRPEESYELKELDFDSKQNNQNILFEVYNPHSREPERIFMDRVLKDLKIKKITAECNKGDGSGDVEKYIIDAAAQPGVASRLRDGLDVGLSHWAFKENKGVYEHTEFLSRKDSFVNDTCEVIHQMKLPVTETKKSAVKSR